MLWDVFSLRWMCSKQSQVNLLPHFILFYYSYILPFFHYTIPFFHWDSIGMAFKKVCHPDTDQTLTWRASAPFHGGYFMDLLQTWALFNCQHHSRSNLVRLEEGAGLLQMLGLTLPWSDVMSKTSIEYFSSLLENSNKDEKCASIGTHLYTGDFRSIGWNAIANPLSPLTN